MKTRVAFVTIFVCFYCFWPPAQAEQVFQKEAEIRLTADTPLLFQNTTTRIGKAGETFTVIQHNTTTKRVYILTTDGAGKKIAVNVADTMVELLPFDIASLRATLLRLFGKTDFANATTAIEAAVSRAPNDSRVQEYRSCVMAAKEAYDKLLATARKAEAASQRVQQLARNAQVGNRTNPLTGDQSGLGRAQNMKQESDRITAAVNAEIEQANAGWDAAKKRLTNALAQPLEIPALPNIAEKGKAPSAPAAPPIIVSEKEEKPMVSVAQSLDKPPYDFTFGHMPFGLEIEEVLALMEKVPGINPSKIFASSPTFNPWENMDEVRKLFPTGLYTYTGFERNKSIPSFHPQLVASRFTQPMSKASSPVECTNVTWMLYFQKDVQDGRYKLFASTKTFVGGKVYTSGTGANYRKAFSAVKESMTKEIGKQPLAFETKWAYEGALRDAAGAVWDDPVHKVLLVATNTPSEEFLCDKWCSVYISKHGFDNYLRSLNAAVPPTMEEFDTLAAKLLADMSGEPLDKVLASIRAVQAADKPILPKQFAILGNIIQKLREGLLVKCMGAGGPAGDGRELAEGVVLLVDHPKYSDLFPADYVNVMVNTRDAGKFEYINKSGAKNIVRRLKYESDRE